MHCEFCCLLVEGSSVIVVLAPEIQAHPLRSMLGCQCPEPQGLPPPPPVTAATWSSISHGHKSETRMTMWRPAAVQCLGRTPVCAPCAHETPSYTPSCTISPHA